MTNPPSWSRARTTAPRTMPTPSQGTSIRARSDPEDLLLLGLELLVAENALLAQLGEPLQLTHVLRFGRSDRLGGRGRLLAATEVLLHPQPVLDERATPLHARDGPVVLPRLHPAGGPCRY